MARKLEVFLYNQRVGLLSEEPQGYCFTYYRDYHGPAISLSLPVRTEPYLSKKLHPFFHGLAPEGWLLKRYAEIQKIDEKDLFGLLMKNGNDLLGALVLKEVLS